MINLITRIEDRKDYLREIKARELRVNESDNYSRRHIDKLKQEIVSNENKIRALEDNEERLLDNLVALKREQAQKDIVKATLSQLNIIG